MNHRPPLARPGRGTLVRWCLWFSLGHTLLLLGLFGRYLAVIPGPLEWPARGFLTLAAPGHALSLALLPALVAVLVALVWPRRGAVGTVLVAAGSLLAGLVAVDTVVFRLYRFHLNAMVWNLLTGGAAGGLLPLSQSTWLWGGVQIAGLVLANLALAALAWRWVRGKPRRAGGWVGLVAVLVLAAGHLLHTWADAWGYVPITRQVRYLPHYYPLTAESLLKKLGLAPAVKPPRPPKVPAASSLAYPLEPLRFEAPAQRPNVLLLLVEALRFDFLSPEVTPSLWRFAQQSWTFERHFSSGNATRFGMFGLFYGLHGTYWHAALAENQPPVLLTAMADQGYSMGIFSSSSFTSPEFDRTVFAGVRESLDLSGPRFPDSVARDRDLTQRLLGFLGRQQPGQPWFGFAFFDAPHDYNFPKDQPARFTPVVAAVNHLELSGGRDPVPVKNRLLNSLHFVDSQLGLLLEHLEQGGFLENTVVVITGDHGEEFNDNGLGYWGHNGNFSEYQTQVAMVVRWPGAAPGRFTHPTHHVDLAPTLLADAFGCRTPADRYSQGRNLRDASDREFLVVANWNAFAVRQGHRVDVVQPSGTVDTYHANYRPWPDAPLEPQVLLRATQELGRFYSR